MMSAIKNSIICVFAALLLVASNCKKPTEPPTRILNYTLQDAKDYMYFKKGTWWVYENNVTNELDSVYVTNSQLGESTSKGWEDWSRNTTLTQEIMDMNLKSDRVDGWGNRHEYHIWSYGTNANAYPIPERAYQFEKNDLRSNVNGGSGVSQGTMFYSPFNLCTKKDCKYYLDSTLTSYQINGYTFDTVRVFYIEIDPCFPQSNKKVLFYGKSHLYFAKGFGLIKYLHDNYLAIDNTFLRQSWNIKKFNIKK